ncbi:YggT family protein [Ruminiclostridium sufflavum DSM 19573]|uniref:YggT family protein n=1 Tax=Ruminiclostridium sufflavum DSM 19573 TaxID=1121337 RepID=A0A318Y382_9FIRM|nr:YggT family protein [Ruminiclostridium sufflavum]PYG89897.1 YggT family protein [Ruminiclostridium sufflavum DSM 19573]
MYSVYRAIDIVLKIFEFALIARVLLSWLPISRNNKFVELLYTITEPVLAPIRNMLNRSSFLNNSALSMIDFSPIVAFLLCDVVRNVVVMILRMFI